jgi:hypothetical protein
MYRMTPLRGVLRNAESNALGRVWLTESENEQTHG